MLGGLHLCTLVVIVPEDMIFVQKSQRNFTFSRRVKILDIVNYDLGGY